jgi:hypothetical protein
MINPGPQAFLCFRRHLSSWAIAQKDPVRNRTSEDSRTQKIQLSVRWERSEYKNQSSFRMCSAYILPLQTKVADESHKSKHGTIPAVYIHPAKTPGDGSFLQRPLTRSSALVYRTAGCCWVCHDGWRTVIINHMKSIAVKSKQIQPKDQQHPSERTWHKATSTTSISLHTWT